MEVSHRHSPSRPEAGKILVPGFRLNEEAKCSSTHESREETGHLSCPRGSSLDNVSSVVGEMRSLPGGAVPRDWCPKLDRISKVPWLGPRSQVPRLEMVSLAAHILSLLLVYF